MAHFPSPHQLLARTGRKFMGANAAISDALDDVNGIMTAIARGSKLPDVAYLCIPLAMRLLM